MRLRLLLVFVLLTIPAAAQAVWDGSLDSKVRFYQTTDFGIVLAASDNSLYAFDSQTGERLWRRKHKGLDETSITPVPTTDLVLVSTDEGDISRVEAIDLLSGERLWRSDKVRGDVMQLAVDPDADLLAVVLVKKAAGKVGNELKREPVIHALRISDGEEIWKKQLDSDVEMMPSRFDSDKDVPFTLDNYRPPLILDGRVYVFYEGITAYDAKDGGQVLREDFKVNESGLALTEADPMLDDKMIYLSGRGKVRAVNRQTLKVEWEAKDIGNASEIALVGNRLYVRTGGEFTRLKDGETDRKGPFGISAIDTLNGKVLWRFKGADKGMTNFVFPDAQTAVFADNDVLTMLDAQNGKRMVSYKHDIDNAQFVLLNEVGGIVVGGRDEIAAFSFPTLRYETSLPRSKERAAFAKFADPDRALWRVRHKAPGRGVLRIVTGIALRAAALYFRYGSLGSSALNIARGAGTARSLLNLRWSGLKTRFGSFGLTTLASNAAENYVSNRLTVFGIAARTTSLSNRISGLQIRRTALLGRIVPSRADVQESFIDRFDPVRRIEKLSDLLLRRKRLADLRGNYMYYYTDLPAPFSRRGLVGVNVHTGRDERFILVGDPDPKFLTDEAVGYLFSADGNRLSGFEIMQR
ncbi:MAG TPA: PQQ-binding-like beta-propeller repeat protein [Pyrinomonadaceae bacterium]|nr:PQQ-binding-like beta-propeller repeat protein [Pyrinomonadaceae bacterium]